MFTRISRPFIALFLAMLFVAGPVIGQNASSEETTAEIRALLQNRDRQIKSLLRNKTTLGDKDRAELKALINGIIDFGAMAKTALGPHWKELAPEQQGDFIEVFSEIVRSQSLSNLDVYRSEVTYDQIEVAGEKARVSTSVTFKNVPTHVEYVLSRRAGEWRVDDIVLDKVSTAEGYARSFQPIVKKRGFDVLMNSLRKKLDKVTASR